MKTKILIAGGSGLIGSRLSEYLSEQEFEINILTRRQRPNSNRVNYFLWDPSTQYMDINALNDVMVVINLAGAGIADKRWTKRRKAVILNTRIKSTRTLKKYLSASSKKLDLYIGASAIGYYGDQGSRLLKEDAGKGQDYLSDVTNAWEVEHNKLKDSFDRSVILRIGIVLSSKGGALKEILKIARFGLFGFFGNGKAYYSWIHIDDICEIFYQSIKKNKYSGIYNGVSNEAVTIKVLLKVLKEVMDRFGILFGVPQFMLKRLLGEMSQMLLNSTRVVPQKLNDQNHEFIFPELKAALANILDKDV